MELGTDRGDLILKGVKNVKIEWNRRYTTIAVYAILVLVFGVLFLYGVQNYREVKAWFSCSAGDPAALYFRLCDRLPAQSHLCFPG